MIKPIELVIADDHLMVRDGIKELLELDDDIKVKAMAGDGLECIKLAEKIKFDILLLDINMPSMNGLQVLEYFKKEYKDIKILILTIHNQIEYISRAIDLGVDGYLLKDSESSILIEAINTIYKGEKYIEKRLQFPNKIKASHKSEYKMENVLTKREVEVLKLIAEGLYNKEIAFMLKISERTVKNHVSNIFRKINVSDRTQAALYAIKNNYVDMF